MLQMPLANLQHSLDGKVFMQHSSTHVTTMTTGLCSNCHKLNQIVNDSSLSCCVSCCVAKVKQRPNS